MKVRTPKARSQCSAYSVSGSRAIGNAGLEKRTRGLVCQPSCSLASARSLRWRAGRERELARLGEEPADRARACPLGSAKKGREHARRATRSRLTAPAAPRGLPLALCPGHGALPYHPPSPLSPPPSPPSPQPPPRRRVPHSVSEKLQVCARRNQKTGDGTESGQAEKAMPGCLSLGLSV